MRGSTAIAVTGSAVAGAFLLAGAVSYAAQSSPVATDLHGTSAVSSSPAEDTQGARLFERYGCRACHSLSGSGGHVGPALDGESLRKSRAELIVWLDDPSAEKPGTSMPTFHFTPAEEQALADYLSSQKETP